jgi:hypothetical protein
MTLGSENHLPYVYPTKCSEATPKNKLPRQDENNGSENKQTARSGGWPSQVLLHEHKQKFETPNLPSVCIRRWVRIKSSFYFCSDCISLSILLIYFKTLSLSCFKLCAWENMAGLME